MVAVTLPPVVSDPERCSNTDEAWDPHPPHAWESVLHLPPLSGTWERCVWCGGRRG